MEFLDCATPVADASGGGCSPAAGTSTQHSRTVTSSQVAHPAQVEQADYALAVDGEFAAAGRSRTARSGAVSPTLSFSCIRTASLRHFRLETSEWCRRLQHLVVFAHGHSPAGKSLELGNSG